MQTGDRGGGGGLDMREVKVAPKVAQCPYPKYQNLKYVISIHKIHIL